MDRSDPDKYVHTFINRICKVKLSNFYFPGTLPISLDRKSIPLLYGFSKVTHSEYTLSYKADGYNGGRYFLGFLEFNSSPLVFIVDRNFSITYLTVFSVHHDAFKGTLFDIEILRTHDGKDLILIFDTLCVHGNSVQEKYYPIRMDVARAFLNLLPETKKISCDKDTHSFTYSSNFKDSISTFSDKYHIKVKKLYYPQALPFMTGTIYPDDGRIWTSTTTPYSVFRSNPHSILKWKPQHEITIDFYLHTKQTTDWKLPSQFHISPKFRSQHGNYYLYTQQNRTFFLIAKLLLDSKTESGIYEFSWNSQWVLKQRRFDKSKPNQLETVVRTIENIEENITLEELCSYL